jgi:hypothetical protein
LPLRLGSRLAKLTTTVFVQRLLSLADMPRSPDQIPDNIAFAAQELLEAPPDERPAMLEGIAKALTRLAAGQSGDRHPRGL